MKKISCFILLLLLIVAMIGCRSMQPAIGSTSSRNDSIAIRTEHVHDTTIIEKLRTVIQKPDTLYIHDSIVIYKYRDSRKTDTLYRYHTDTITKIQEVIVEKPVGSKFMQRSGIALWIIIGLTVILAIVVIVWKVAKGKIPIINLLSKLK